MCAFNFSPVGIDDYVFGCDKGTFTEILHSDQNGFTQAAVTHRTQPKESHGKPNSICMHIPPMCGIYMVGKSVSSDKSKGGRAVTKKTTASGGVKKTGKAAVNKRISENAQQNGRKAVK